MLKTGNFNYRKWALLQIVDLRNVFAQARTIIASLRQHYSAGFCVKREVTTIWKSDN